MTAAFRCLFVAAAGVAGGAAMPVSPPVFEVPVACTMGKTCVIQQYFDHDPGPGARDYRCGPMSYDGHDGVDIRLPTVAAMTAGVDVVAAAPGTVRATRDGVTDRDVRIGGTAAVAGHECGNGVVIDHGDGWTSQYCHLARGSVAVQPREAVMTGARLGRIGESGDAAFPHLHFSVRHGIDKVDPFAWDAPAGTCGQGRSLWSPAAWIALGYVSPAMLNQGFAATAVTMADIEDGPAAAPPAGRTQPVLVAYVRAIGFAAGDALSLDLVAPGGAGVAHAAVTLDRAMAQEMLRAGARRAGGWSSGRYVAHFVVHRAGAAALQQTFSIDL